MQNTFKKIKLEKIKSGPITSQEKNKNYFQLATSWADDYYARMAASRYRYQVAFLIAMSLCVLLAISITMLAHTREYIPLLVHHYDSGAVTVAPANEHAAPKNQAEIESDLVRYVVSRESYDPASFSEEYKLVSLLSNREISHAYHLQQNANDDQAFIQKFGNKIVRSVKINEVNFLDNEELNIIDKHDKNHKNLAEIHFVVTDKVISSGKESRTPYVAIVSWAYGGIPNDPEVRWMNWNGFMVTNYQRNQRSV